MLVCKGRADVPVARREPTRVIARLPTALVVPPEILQAIEEEQRLFSGYALKIEW